MGGVLRTVRVVGLDAVVGLEKSLEILRIEP
jgi:hypothetical protein